MLSHLQHLIFSKAPTMLKIPLAVVPFSWQRNALDYVLKNLFSEAIDDGDVEFLSGRFLQVSINDLGLTWYVTFDNNQFIVTDKLANNCQCDVSFSANGDDLLLVADRREDPDTLFFQRRLMIEGDTELGLEVKNLIDSVELDQLPPWVNGMIAYCANQIEKKNKLLLA